MEMEKKKIIIREEKPVLNVLQLISTILGAILLFVFGMLLLITLAGCSIINEDTSDCPKDSVSTGSRSGSAIAFSVGDSTAATRTAEGTMTLDGADGTESLQQKGFGVFACHTGVHPYISTSTTPNLMYNQPVTWDGDLSTWIYTPIVYWPNGDDDLPEYVTFFAYGPFSDNAGGCIVDMSLPEEMGDPWLIYQLGGSSSAIGDDGWKARQVDLVYDFRKDQKKELPISSNKVSFDFKHALSCIGDKITVSCDESVKTRLKGLYTTSPVTLTVSTIRVDYQLTRKGRLVLNNASEPNWQAVESEDAKVNRNVTFTPNLVMARATSSSACTTTNFSSGAGNGIFYIPLEVGDSHQKVTVSADYTITSADPTEMIDEGTVTASLDLNYVANANEGRDINVTLSIPDIACSGKSLSEAAVGMIICSHGKVHTATDGDLACGGMKVAVVAYTGSESGEGGYPNGLAVALNDADASAWCNQTENTCLSGQSGSYATAIISRNGIDATTELVGLSSHVAATKARNYKYDNSVSAGAHPAGTSQWFLPALGQWNLMVKAMTGGLADVTTSGNDAYKAAGFNTRITAAGGTGVLSGLYWSSTESSAANAWYMSFKDGKTNSNEKTTGNYVRPVLAF